MTSLIYSIVMIKFFFQNNNRKNQLFEKIFLLIYINIELILDIFHFLSYNANIQFNIQKIAKILLKKK